MKTHSQQTRKRGELSQRDIKHLQKNSEYMFLVKNKQTKKRVLPSWDQTNAKNVQSRCLFNSVLQILAVKKGREGRNATPLRAGGATFRAEPVEGS